MDDPRATEAGGWINRNVIGFAVNRFLSDFGHEAGTAVLPLFLAAIGAQAGALGVIEGSADALWSFAKLIGGWLGDRVEHRKPWAAAGYLLTGVTTGLYGVFAWWPWTLAVRSVGWAGRGLRSPLHDAMLTDSVPPSARGRAFGFDEAADTAGAVAGPLAALAIVGLAPRVAGDLHGFNVIFWLAAIPGVLSALSIVVFVKESPHPVSRNATLLGSLQRLPPS
jgi:MFS family permease